MARDVDVITLQPVETPGALNLWTDYLGETPLLDYQLDYVDEWQTTVTERRAYLAGFGPQAYQNLPAGETFYLHGDLIGSTMVLSDATGGPPAPAISYAAFGEPVGAVAVEFSRYRYAGAWGYESNLLELQGPDASLAPISLLHVGWRWYQPSIGRFVQRDPIGLWGGKNVYAYVRCSPIAGVDASGLDRWVEGSGHKYLVYEFEGTYYRLEIKMEVVGADEPWWHWPKDLVQNALNGVLCVTVGGVGKVLKTPTTRPGRPPDVLSDPLQDKILHEKYDDGDSIYYDVWWRNCRDFAEDEKHRGIYY